MGSYRRSRSIEALPSLATCGSTTGIARRSLPTRGVGCDQEPGDARHDRTAHDTLHGAQFLADRVVANSVEGRHAG